MGRMAIAARQPHIPIGGRSHCGHDPGSGERVWDCLERPDRGPRLSRTRIQAGLAPRRRPAGPRPFQTRCLIGPSADSQSPQLRGQQPPTSVLRRLSSVVCRLSSVKPAAASGSPPRTQGIGPVRAVPGGSPWPHPRTGGRARGCSPNHLPVFSARYNGAQPGRVAPTANQAVGRGQRGFHGPQLQ
jgi:hypothetical protein